MVRVGLAQEVKHLLLAAGQVQVSDRADVGGLAVDVSLQDPLRRTG